MSNAGYRAVVCEALGPLESLRLRRLPSRPLRPGAVRVAIEAAGINFPDVLMIQGLYQHRSELPFVPGLEAAGIVVDIAPDVSGVRAGDKVIARMRTGAYAEETVVPAGQIVPLPEGASTPVSQAVDAFDAHAGKPARFSGRIAQVCQTKGCWMVLEDNGRTARVMFGDHAFQIPKDSTGPAEVHGVLSRRQLTPEQVKHLEEDSKGLPVSPVEYRILADGLVLQAP